MSKFKVGDKVSSAHYGGEWLDCKVLHRINGGAYDGYYRVEGEEGSIGIIEEEQLSHADSSPIRTVTRKEIVAGTYGIVDVATCNVKNSAAVAILTKWSDGENAHTIATADQLREAAHTLNQIAEALEDNAE